MYRLLEYSEATLNVSAPPSGEGDKSVAEGSDDHISGRRRSEIPTVSAHSNCIAIGPCEPCPPAHSQV